MSARAVAVMLALVAALAGCGDDGSATRRSSAAGSTPTSSAPSTSTTSSSTTSTGTPSSSATTTTLPVDPRPAWLGQRPLPLRPDGLGEIRPTPPELADRRFATVDRLEPPRGYGFTVRAGPVPEDVVARSTWQESCPVGLEDLRYLTLPFIGFDGLPHTGELIVHADAVDAVSAGFEHLYETGFPIEEMRVTRAEELEAHPTGDGNNTGAFVCRSTVGASGWSQHAYGRAVDINPFHNPYVRDDVVVPELASAYTDRSDLRPGMLTAGDVAGFLDAGWGWGGTWSSSKDYMHLSATGR